MSGEAEMWDGALAEHASPPPLLQSWAWGEVQASSGWRVERLRLVRGATASVQLRNFGRAQEAYVPRGPVPASVEAIDWLVAWARNAGIARLVVDPETTQEIKEDLRERGFNRVPSIQPHHTRIVKMLPATELLASFRQGRRYNIRAGERRGVVVEEGKDAKELWRQSTAVERRESIRLPSRAYYDLLLELLPWCRTYTAFAPDSHEALATVLVARHAGRAYSLFAGRTGRRRELMGNDLAWWVAIRSAAEAGCTDFDLWGVPPPDTGPEHAWHGLGAFKAEFGGEVVSYAGAWELVLSPAGARMLNLERKARAYIRGVKRNSP